MSATENKTAKKVYTGPSGIQGTGVFATRDLARGELVLAIDDSRVVDDDHPLNPLAGEFELHCDYLEDGRVVLMLYPERHINHSCDPNTYVKTILGTRFVFALRGIKKDEEITYDYCINGGGDTVWECHCGVERCLHTIHSDFFHLPFERQVEYLPLLDEWYVREHRAKVEALIRRLLK